MMSIEVGFVRLALCVTVLGTPTSRRCRRARGGGDRLDSRQSRTAITTMMSAAYTTSQEAAGGRRERAGRRPHLCMAADHRRRPAVPHRVLGPRHGAF
jgi:hypothetical protein